MNIDSLFQQVRARFVDDWHQAGKWWSIRMNAIGVVLYPLLLSVQAMPPDIQALFPLKYRAIVAGVFQVAALLARVYVQKKPGG